MGAPLSHSAPGADFNPGRRLEALAENLRDPRRFLVRAGLILAERARHAFDIGVQARGGYAWPARAVPNVIGILDDLAHDRKPPARRWDPRPAGVDTGLLRGSLNAQAVHLVSGDTVEVGTNAAGAGMIQHGGEVDVEVDDALKTKIKAHLDGAKRSAKSASTKARKLRALDYEPGMKKAAETAEGKALAATARAGDLENALRWLTAPAVKGFTAKVPARPYLAITDEDIADIAELWTGDLLAERGQPMPGGGTP